MDKHIVVVGSLNCDLIVLQDRLPELGETMLGNDASVCSGGKGANQAVQCAKLGAETYMVGKLGKDMFGDLLRNTVASYGVNTSCLLTGKGTTGIASIHTLPGGSTQCTVVPGTNYEITAEDIEALREVIFSASVIVLQMEIPVPVTEYVIREARKAGVYTVLNAAPAAPLSEDIFEQLDCLVVNEIEAGFYAGEKIVSHEEAEAAGQKLREKFRGTLIITLGDRGSVLLSDEGIFHFYPTPGITAVETTGCGDSYVGAFAYQKFLGKTDEEACRFAAFAAESAVMKVGAQASMPTLREAEAYIAGLK